jgi:hypothetical protein
MGENIQIKYKYAAVSSGFSKTLSQRVDEYFQTRRISRHANLEMISKTVLGFALWIVTYDWLMTGRFFIAGGGGDVCASRIRTVIHGI